MTVAPQDGCGIVLCRVVRVRVCAARLRTVLLPPLYMLTLHFARPDFLRALPNWAKSHTFAVMR
jgi:hypothetical protein